MGGLLKERVVGLYSGRSCCIRRPRRDTNGGVPCYVNVAWAKSKGHLESFLGFAVENLFVSLSAVP